MAVFYVSAQTGNDSNDGTSAEAAKATLQAGIDLIDAAGDIVYVAPGTYRGIHNFTSAVNGNITTHNKLIGDPDCEQFPNEEKGVVRITNTDEFDSTFTTSTSGTNQYTLYVNKQYTEIHNLHIDGGGNPLIDSGDLIVSHTGYCVAGQYDGRYNAYNCIAQNSGYGFHRMNTTNCITIACGLYGFSQGFKHVHSAAIACYGGFFAGDYVVDCLGVGSYLANFYNCDNVCNGFSMGATYGYRNTTNDEVHDSVHLGGLGGFYGTVAGGGGIMSGSYIGGSLYGAVRGKISGVIFGNGLQRMGTSTSNLPNSSGFNVGDAGTKKGGAVLWSYNGARKFIEAAKPTLLNYWLQGKSDSHHDDTSRNYQSSTSYINVPHECVKTDILGHPREMGHATHSLHTIEANISQRDLGAFEYTSVAYTSSVSHSGEGIAINGEGVQSFQIAVSSGSAVTASVAVRWINDINISADHKPGILIQYAPGFASSSTMTDGTAQNYITGSQNVITSSYTNVGASTFSNVSISVPPSNVNQIYDLHLQSRASGSLINDFPASGSTFTAVFSDLEIT